MSAGDQRSSALGINHLDELSTAGITVRAELGLSYENLDQDTQRAFRHMGMLPGGDFAAWTLGTLADGTGGQQLVEQLTTAGLLEPATIDATGEPRYRSHDLIALYAQELAAAADPALMREAIGRLLETLISLAQTIHPRTSQFLEALPSEEPFFVSTSSPHTAAPPIRTPGYTPNAAFCSPRSNRPVV